MAKWLLSTEVVVAVLGEGNTTRILGSRPLREVAVSAVSFEWISADLELAAIRPSQRQQLRTNVTRFRELVRASGGQIPAISTRALERWGRLLVLSLEHSRSAGSKELMPVEERLVVATAASEGLVYTTFRRGWNTTLETDLGISLELLEE